jgi:lysophospholipase L1-like esterase
MEGYRPMMYKVLKERFPDTEFKFTAAGVSSTCSDTGAFRLSTDVLAEGPVDLFFVEYAVNDDQDGNLSRKNCIRGMEGVISQVRAHNPNADIVMTHFVNESILFKLQKGEKPTSVQAHSDVAAHHGVSVNHLAQEVAECITAGKLDWKKFGGVHPAKYGNTMCATMIKNALLEEWSKPLAKDAVKVPHKKYPLMDPKSYSRGRFLPVSAVTTDENWQISVPQWKKEISGNVRKRFLGKPFIHSDKAGAKLTVKFTGTAIGAYILAGPDSGILKCRVDGGEPIELDPIHRYSGFHYPRTVMFFNELDEGEHTLELEILENRDGRLKPGGTAFRALHFTAN